MPRPKFGRPYNLVQVTVIISVIIIQISVLVESKRDPKPWLGFVQRKASSIWKWGTVLGLYGAVGGDWQREVRNPRLRKLYSTHWLRQATFRRNFGLLQHNATSMPLNATLRKGQVIRVGDGYDMTFNEFLERFFWPKFTEDGMNDPHLEKVYDKLIDMVDEMKNATADRIGLERNKTMNQTQQHNFNDLYDKFRRDPGAFNLSGFKQAFRRAWFIIPQEPLYKQVPGKMWRVQPKPRDVANPGYNPRRVDARKRDDRENLNQGQIWRKQKQKKERIKQKKLDSLRATRKAIKQLKLKMLHFMRAPHESSLTEDMISKKIKETYMKWDVYRKVLKVPLQKQRLKKKQLLRKLKKMMKKRRTDVPVWKIRPVNCTRDRVQEKKDMKKERLKLAREEAEARRRATRAPKTTRRTFRRWTRRSKLPYTGTRIIGKKEREMLRKERRRIRNRSKRWSKRMALLNMTTPTKRKRLRDLQKEQMEKMVANVSLIDDVFIGRRIAKEQERLEAIRRRYMIGTVPAAVQASAVESIPPEKTEITEKFTSELAVPTDQATGDVLSAKVDTADNTIYPATSQPTDQTANAFSEKQPLGATDVSGRFDPESMPSTITSTKLPLVVTEASEKVFVTSESQSILTTIPTTKSVPKGAAAKKREMQKRRKAIETTTDFLYLPPEIEAAMKQHNFK